jgi:hypothetical protein
VTDLASLSRAELLERCRAAGLAATAWKKERMLSALIDLAGEAAEAATAEEFDAALEAAEPAEAEVRLQRRRETGWCSHVPMWSASHRRCPAAREGTSQACACPCHAEGWEAPAAPEGAQLNRFYAV